MKNPLLQDNELPPFPSILPEHIVPAIESILKEVREGIGQLLEGKVRDYKSVVQAREDLENKLHCVWSPISHLNSVMSSVELRDAHAACLSMITDYYSEVGQNRKLFDAYCLIKQSQEYVTLSQSCQKSVDNAIRDFRLSGIDLPKPEREKFSKLSREISILHNTFNNNLLDATEAWQKLVTEEESLPGLSRTVLTSMRQKAKDKGLVGCLLTLDAPCFLAIMTYCEKRNLRRELYMALGTRASRSGPQAGIYDNTEIIQSILVARLEQARLLGFESYADFSIARKMAGSAGEVLAFLENLANKCSTFAKNDFSALASYASLNGGPRELKPWDVAFYSEKFKKSVFDVSEDELRPYFPAPTVLTGMFEVVTRLFDITVKEVKGIPVWHEHVLTYEVHKDGSMVGLFYLDLYARSRKRGGAWMDDCRSRRRDSRGVLQIPVAYLTCNFTGPLGTNPALLSHSEVVTLFHEFGHGLHHLLTKIDVASVSGINGVAWDAVELPSQFLENFCWQKESLSFISRHYKTKEPIPEELLNKLLQGKNHNSAMMMARQLEFGLFDFRLHLEFDPSVESQVQKLLDEVRKKVAVVNPPVGYAFQNGFSHIFGGSYAAGYYSYKWAEVLSADVFAKFLEDGLFNQKTGQKFMSTFLEKGGSEDAMDLFVAFRGRKPKIEPLLIQDGIMV